MKWKYFPSAEQLGSQGRSLWTIPTSQIPERTGVSWDHFWRRLRRQPKAPSAQQGHDVWCGNKVDLNKVSKSWQDPTSPRSISWGLVLQSAAQRWHHRLIQEEPGKQLDLVIFTDHSCHWYCASRSYETYPVSLSKRNPHLLTSDGQWLFTFVILSNLNEKQTCF